MEHEAIQKIKSTVNRGITTISVKTASSLEKSKIKTHIETLENEVRSMIINIGECTFEIWQSDADYEQISELCKTVAQKNLKSRVFIKNCLILIAETVKYLATKRAISHCGRSARNAENNISIMSTFAGNVERA